MPNECLSTTPVQAQNVEAAIITGRVLASSEPPATPVAHAPSRIYRNHKANRRLDQSVAYRSKWTLARAMRVAKFELAFRKHTSENGRVPRPTRGKAIQRHARARTRVLLSKLHLFIPSMMPEAETFSGSPPL